MAGIRPGRELRQRERDVVNLLVDQGWTYVPPARGGHFKVIPLDPDQPMVVHSKTSSDYNAFNVWCSQLRRSGAQLDDATLEQQKLANRRRRNNKAKTHVLKAVETDLQPVTTHGAWWRPSNPQTAGAGEPASIVRAVERPPRPSAPDPYATGSVYTMGQARQMLYEGYHITQVVKRTGWGRAHFSDILDPYTGYLALS